jgi:hypothetical protein
MNKKVLTAQIYLFFQKHTKKTCILINARFTGNKINNLHYPKLSFHAKPLNQQMQLNFRIT